MNRRKSMWQAGRVVVGGLALLLFGAGACAQTEERGSGETHFLSSCQGRCSEGLECLCGVCTVPCGAPGTCAELSSEAVCIKRGPDECPATTLSCDVTCEVTSDCQALPGDHRCERGFCREHPPTQEPASTTPLCDGGCGQSSCSSPQTSCQRDAICSTLNCGGSAISETGCLRPDCETDADCPSNERCAVVPSRTFACNETAGACACSPTREPSDRRACSPVAIAGPRGSWTELLVQSSGVCSEIYTCFFTQRFFPDGRVEKTIDQPAPEPTEIVEGRLTPADLTTLTAIVDGATLRAELRDKKACSYELDAGYIVQLQLDDGTTLENDVGSCLFDLGRLEPFPTLAALARRY